MRVAALAALGILEAVQSRADFSDFSGRHAERIPVHALPKLEHVLGAIMAWDNRRGLARDMAPRWCVRDLKAPPAWLVPFVLCDIVGCSNLGRHEKLLFEVPLQLDGRRMTVSLEKFGMRGYVDRDDAADEEEAQHVVQDVMNRIGRAAPIIEKHVLRPIAAEQVRSGHVTIDNRFGHHLGMYRYFRDRSESLVTEAETATDPPPETGEGPPPRGRWVTYRSVRRELRRDASFDAAAGVAAFFSLLEHLLVFQLAFDFDPTSDDLERFVGDDWAAKFRRVIDITDLEAKRHYDALRAVAQEVRNPAMHGGFDHQKSRFHFHLDNVGAVSAQLSRTRNTADYRFVDMPGPKRRTDVWEAIDAFFEWAKSGPLGYAWAFAMGGFDMAFDEENRAEMVKATITVDQFDTYLEHRAHWQMIADNMDW